MRYTVLSSVDLEQFGLDPDACVYQNGILDVRGPVNLAARKLTVLPFKFGIIYGDFDCSYNDLEALINGPRIVHGHYNCAVNQLKSLAGAPETCSSFDCSYNHLSDLLYAPRVKRGFYAGYNNLVTLRGAPPYAQEFAAHRNQLSSLEHAPSCDGVFDVSENPLLPGVRPPAAVTGEIRR